MKESFSLNKTVSKLALFSCRKFWLLHVFRVLDIIDCSKFSFYGFAFNTSFHMYGNHCTVSDLNRLVGNDRIPIELLKVISFRMSFPTFIVMISQGFAVLVFFTSLTSLDIAYLLVWSC